MKTRISDSGTGVTGVVGAESVFRSAVRRFFKNKVAAAAFFTFAFIVLSCLFLPFVISESPVKIDMEQLRLPPSWEHIFGTDFIGRDLFARMLYGGRVTLGIMSVVTVLATVVGGTIGITAGYYGGRADFYLMRFMDIVESVPSILLALMVEVALGFGGGNFKYGLAISAMPAFARLMRATVMSIVKSEYIEAARALGADNKWIIMKHVLHNVAAPLVIQVMTCAAEALLSCTIMGYLGIGINPPTPEWGGIVQDTRDYIRTMPYIAMIPSAVIIITEMSLHFIGSGLRDALDPHELGE